MKRILVAAIVAVVTFTGAEAAAAATVTVKSGDTLSSIATANQVQGGWSVLYDANRTLIGPNPNLIKVGQILNLPGTCSALPSNRTGMYVGPGEIAKHNANKSWLNRRYLDATDYLDPSWNDTWNPVALERWGTWKKAGTNRQLVLGIHMVPKEGGSLAKGLSGAYDDQYRALAQMMVQNGLGDSVIRLGYEPNNPNIGPWHGTSDPESYKAMYRRAHGIMKSVSPCFKFDYNLAIGQSGKVTSFETLYPGDNYVDIVGLNVYDMFWKTYSATPYSRWQNTLKQTMGVNQFKAFAARHNKPVSYPEWGLYKKGDVYGGGGDSYYFIDRMSELVKGSAYNAYFNLNFTAYGSKLDMFPSGKAQYKYRFGNR